MKSTSLFVEHSKIFLFVSTFVEIGKKISQTSKTDKNISFQRLAIDSIKVGTCSVQILC